MGPIISIYNPSKLVFGADSFSSFVADIITSGAKRIFILTVSEILEQVESGFAQIRNSGCEVAVNTDIRQEPSFDDYKKLLAKVDQFNPDAVVGIGGGSVLDAAKLIAATTGNEVKIEEFLKGNKKLNRNTQLICLPTTSGTGSEVSPNAIFFDPETGGKVGVIDPQLVPDAAYIDPMLTISVPPAVTASTGLDALTHCIEAYANRLANPINDLLAFEGIRLIGQNLKTAFENGNDVKAREKVALGSMYGGMCLGPVNTGAVHALAYPLGSNYKIAHGVSNAMLLPFVLEYNLEAAEEKYANVALALGVDDEGNDKETALAGIQLIREMIRDFKIPGSLSDLNIGENEIEEMAHSALKIQRLLKNNVREVKLQDAIDIYTKAK
ncbi:iron-containing alcohol dehydrogenase [Maribellus sediminis]|uniref:iron-containing alcohol dehydrogenase n=1 Tax=Maribellus sediminis TaxID=2696285 RepID=UPI00142F3D41|nr:iron-containing alcohol dehydrogenase [Maribellus sediminis]